MTAPHRPAPARVATHHDLLFAQGILSRFAVVGLVALALTLVAWAGLA